MTIKAGDVVRLRSGGVLMTVESSEDPPIATRPIHCIWFDPEGQLKGGDFRKDDLERIVVER